MMLAIIGHCDKATKAQFKAHANFSTIMDQRTILNFIEILQAICFDTSASGLLFPPMPSTDQLLHLIKFDNRGNNMHDYVFDLKNLYASGEAASFKFPMGNT